MDGWMKYITNLNEEEVSYSETEKLKTHYWTSSEDKRKELDDEPKLGVENQLKQIRGFQIEESLSEMNLSFEDRILNILGKQNKILIEQHKLQKRTSNNVLFFFWITIISLFILPIIWIIFGLSILL